jgi:hypothetical protein
VNVEVVDQARTRELRRAVLRPHLSLDDVLPGDEVPNAIHIAALDGDEAIGACFIYPEPCPWRSGPACRLRSMATAESRQGTGVGSAVLAGAVSYIAEHGGGTLWLHARQAAVPFYARNELRVHGEPFVEYDLPHREMWRPVDNFSAAPSRPS